MRNVKEMIKHIHKGKRLVNAIAAAVLAGSMFLGTGVTAEAAKLSDVFDTQAYADKYPDLQAAFGHNVTALFKHYKEHGIAEKREAGGILDVVRYREAYPDLDAAFGDNWDAYVNHYLVFGAKEGRENFTDFDGLAYAERYEDLKEAYGDDLLALYRHYQAFGKTEGRDAGAEVYEEPEEEETSDSESGAHTETVHNHDGGVAVYDAGLLVKVTYYNDDGSIKNWYEHTYNNDGSTVCKYYIASYSDGNVSGSLRGMTVYYSDGSRTHVTISAPGITSTEEYDSGNRLIKTTRYVPGDSTNFRNFITIIAGQKIVGKTIVGNDVTYGYDSAGKQYKAAETSYYKNGNIKHVIEYDSKGNQVKSTYYNEDGSIAQ